MNKRVMNKWLIVGALFAFGCNPQPKVDQQTQPSTDKMVPSVPEKTDRPDKTMMKPAPEACSDCGGYSVNDAKAVPSEPVVEQKEVVAPARVEEILVPEVKTEIAPVAEAVQN